MHGRPFTSSYPWSQALFTQWNIYFLEKKIRKEKTSILFKPVLVVSSCCLILLSCLVVSCSANLENHCFVFFLAGFWPSKPTVWLKFGPKLGPNIRFNFEYPRESIGGVKQTFWAYYTFSSPCSNKVPKVYCGPETPSLQVYCSNGKEVGYIQIDSK